MSTLIGDSIPNVEHRNEYRDIPCRECREIVSYNASTLEFFGGNESIVVCDSCCEANERETKSEAVFKQYQGRIEDHIPVFYLETDFNKLPKSAQNIWRYGYQSNGVDSGPIQQWDHRSQKGIYILGQSRTGKTRTLCTLLKRLYQDEVPFKLFEAGQFHAALNDAKRSAFYSRWIKEQISVPVLAIDDLFAEKLTETIQAGLFEIIEQRMARKLPILITTQVKRSDAIMQFNDPKRGEALLNRLRESCNLYVVNQETLQEKIA